MSLFNDISESLSATLGSGSVTGAINRTVGNASNGIAGAVFGNGPLAKAASSVLRGQAQGLVNRATSRYSRQINGVGGALGAALNGNYQEGALRLLDSGVIPGSPLGLGANAFLQFMPLKLLGGITMDEVMAAHSEMAATDYARKNHFLLQVESRVDGEFERFNFFAVELDYSPSTTSGEKHKIGSAHADSVNSGDPTELRITTMDDEAGTIKAWFDAHSGLCVNQDGTVGLPADYAIKIDVLHSTLKDVGGYRKSGWYRPASIDHSLSRREAAHEELSLSFMQIDTFFDGR